MTEKDEKVKELEARLNFLENNYHLKKPNRTFKLLIVIVISLAGISLLIYLLSFFYGLISFLNTNPEPFIR
ncbi:hypothetical protein [Paenibacillus graminis]|uniref:hypothetical protein n=1 Tax=Paenibacillus graminis TaxID=189425 RepID=UPI002DBEF586|nr:hypothetical protein [Paenibacillus graminis]MEC0168154.1 hypothetical protein [Paenibacillus graminis]